MSNFIKGKRNAKTEYKVKWNNAKKTTFNNTNCKQKGNMIEENEKFIWTNLLQCHYCKHRMTKPIVVFVVDVPFQSFNVLTGAYFKIHTHTMNKLNKFRQIAITTKTPETG